VPVNAIVKRPERKQGALPVSASSKESDKFLRGGIA
jgi:hypothetical protein